MKLEVSADEIDRLQRERDEYRDRWLAALGVLRSPCCDTDIRHERKSCLPYCADCGAEVA